MPTFLIFHTNYWEFSDTNITPVVTAKSAGYPAWQASVITPSLFGIIGAWIDTWMVRWRWWKAFAPKVHRLTLERRDVLVHVLDLLGSDTYTSARQAVRKTATTHGFNRPDAWMDLRRSLKDSPGQAENVFRHLEAMRLLKRDHQGSSFTNPTAHLVTELAYVGFAKHPRVP